MIQVYLLLSWVFAVLVASGEHYMEIMGVQWANKSKLRSPEMSVLCSVLDSGRVLLPVVYLTHTPRNR
jgi:hypothetical protein